MVLWCQSQIFDFLFLHFGFSHSGGKVQGIIMSVGLSLTEISAKWANIYSSDFSMRLALWILNYFHNNSGTDCCGFCYTFIFFCLGCVVVTLLILSFHANDRMKTV